MSKQGEKQGEKLSDIDKMLLGEVELSTARGITKVNKGGPYDPEHYSGYKCTMGVSIPVDSKGNAIKDEEGNLNNDGEDTKGAIIANAKAVPKKRGPTSIDGAADEAPSKKRSAAKIANGFTAVNDNTNDNVEEPITPKRRAPRTTAPGKAKNSEEYDDATIDAPITPPSKRASPQKAANGKITTNGEGSEEIFSPTKSISNGIQGVNVRGTPRKRQAPKEKAASPVKIPNSWEEADAADRMLVTMKDEGKSWDDIRKTWKTMTDQDTAASTLPNRYKRLRTNMMHFQTGDDAKLMNSVKDVENILEKEKWILISKAMDKRGATGYPINFLQKKHKEFTEAIKAGTAGDLLGAMMQEFDGAERETRGEGSGLDSDKDVKEEVTA